MAYFYEENTVEQMLINNIWKNVWIYVEHLKYPPSSRRGAAYNKAIGYGLIEYFLVYFA